MHSDDDKDDKRKDMLCWPAFSSEFLLCMAIMHFTQGGLELTVYCIKYYLEKAEIKKRQNLDVYCLKYCMKCFQGTKSRFYNKAHITMQDILTLWTPNYFLPNSCRCQINF